MNKNRIFVLWTLFSLGILVLSGCVKAPKEVPKDFHLKYSWGSCHQTRGWHALEINPSGQAVLILSENGIYNKKEYNFTEQELLEIYQEVVKNNFFKLEEQYSNPNLIDGNCLHLKVWTDVKKHKISIENKDVREVKQITDKIKEILESKDEDWKRLNKEKLSNKTLTFKSSTVLKVKVLNRKKFQQLVGEGNLNFTQPSGLPRNEGPISLDIAASRLQPIQGNSTIPIIVAITNNGRGYLKKITDFMILSKPIILNRATLETAHFCKQKSLAERCRNELYENLKESLQRKKGKAGLKRGDSIVTSCPVTVKNPENQSLTFPIKVSLKYRYSYVSVQS